MKHHINKKNILLQLSPLLLLIFIDSFSYFVIIPVLLKLFFHYDGLLPTATDALRNTITSATISLPMLTALLAAPIVGSASDKYGRKKTLLFCLGCVALGFLFPILGIVKKNIYLIFLGRIISGIGTTSQPVAQAAVADVCTRENKAIFLGSIALMMTLALILGPLAGGFLINANIVSWFNVKTPFEFALILSLINLLLILFCFKETMQSNKQTELFSLHDALRGLLKLIKRYRIGGFIFLFFSLELGWSQYYQSISLFLHQHFHFSSEKIGVFNANMGIGMVLGLLILYPFLLRIVSVKNIMQYSILFLLFGLLTCALFPFPQIQWIISVCIAICTGIAYVSLVTLISNQVDNHSQGIAMGYLSSLLYLAWMITGLESGLLVSLHAALPLYVAAVFLGIACAGFFGLTKEACLKSIGF